MTPERSTMQDAEDDAILGAEDFLPDAVALFPTDVPARAAEIMRALDSACHQFIGEPLDSIGIAHIKQSVCEELSRFLILDAHLSLTFGEVMADMTFARGKDENSVDITFAGRTEEALRGFGFTRMIV